jgi:hypothetical protein
LLDAVEVCVEVEVEGVFVVTVIFGVTFDVPKEQTPLFKE